MIVKVYFFVFIIMYIIYKNGLQLVYKKKPNPQINLENFKEFKEIVLDFKDGFIEKVKK